MQYLERGIRHWGRVLAIATLVLTLQACVSLGLAPAKGFDAQWAYGYGAYTGVMNFVSAALDRQSMSKEQGRRIVTIADEARALMDTAQALRAEGNEAEAHRTLQLAVTVLTRLQAHLQKGDLP